MQRYFAAVLTSNHCDSTSDPGATSLGAMANLSVCVCRGIIGEDVGDALSAIAGACGPKPPSGSAARLTARPYAVATSISAPLRKMKSAYSAPQARHWVARAILRAGRRGDEAMGEVSMLTPETGGVNIVGLLAIHGKSRQMSKGCRSAPDDATLGQGKWDLPI